MKALNFFVGVIGLAAAAAVLAQAQSGEPRVLKRAWVTFCSAPEVAAITVDVVPVELPDGSVVVPDVAVTGDLPGAEIGCEFTDTYVNGQAEGSLMLWRDGEGPIEQMLFTAIIHDGRLSYSIADWVSMDPTGTSGAEYRARSALVYDEDNRGLQYNVAFLRNGADDIWHEVPSNYELIEPTAIHGPDGYVGPHRDPSTIMRVQKDVDGGVVIFTLDYRDVGQ